MAIFARPHGRNHRHPMPKWHRHPSMPQAVARRAASAWLPGASGLELGPLVHDPPVDDRGHDARLTHLAGPAIEQVAIEHDEIGRLADLDRADVALEVVDPGGTEREALERGHELDPLVGQERRLLAAMLDADPVDRD